VAGPSGSVPLVLGAGRPEQRWRNRFGMFVPLPASSDDLERWFQSGAAHDSGNGGPETAVIRMTSPEPLRVVYISRLNLVIGSSAVLLLFGLLAARLPGGIAGPLVALAAGAAAVAAVIDPQPAAEAAAAAEPGAAALALVLIIQTGARWYYRQRVTYLPGFTRSRPESPLTSTGGSRPSDRPQPSLNGSTGSARGAPQPASSGS
jgi:hypothetical protein